MPLKDAHLVHADKIQSAYEDLLVSSNQHPECIAILIFYRGLHLIEALFSLDPTIGHCHSHQQREDILKYQRRFEKIWKHYYPLYKASLIARYLSDENLKKRTFLKCYTHNGVQTVLIDHHLWQVEKSIKRGIEKLTPKTHPQSK